MMKCTSRRTLTAANVVLAIVSMSTAARAILVGKTPLALFPAAAGRPEETLPLQPVAVQGTVAPQTSAALLQAGVDAIIAAQNKQSDSAPAINHLFGEGHDATGPGSGGGGADGIPTGGGSDRSGGALLAHKTLEAARATLQQHLEEKFPGKRLLTTRMDGKLIVTFLDTRDVSAVMSSPGWIRQLGEYPVYANVSGIPTGTPGPTIEQIKNNPATSNDVPRHAMEFEGYAGEASQFYCPQCGERMRLTPETGKNTIQQGAFLASHHGATVPGLGINSAIVQPTQSEPDAAAGGLASRLKH